MNPLRHIRIVLVRPIYGGNLGSVCRAMKNMGLGDLALVAPAATLDFAEAQKMAIHAVDILDRRRVHATLPEAVADCALVAGTTARPGLYRSHSRAPREWAAHLVQAAQDERVAVVFGPEDDGLSNEELALCTQIVRIPSSPRYASLNLAQAVMICCYEIFLAAGEFEPPKERSPEAPSVKRERMFAIWREMLLRIGFCDEEKVDHMMMGVRRIFSRGPLSEADCNILMGVARQSRWAAEHGSGRRGSGKKKT
jgi:tRNA/rRNA methyltransferase